MGKGKEKNDNLSALEELENQEAQNVEAPIIKEPGVAINQEKNLLDGYMILSDYEMPQDGVLYPEFWKIAYRCPTSEEVAQFSTINEKDQPGIMNAMESLIRKCVLIYDTKNEMQIDSGEINDCHRIFFMLLLRKVYLNNEPVEFNSVCTSCQSPYKPDLQPKDLVYPELSEKLLDAFDGRKFNLDWPGIDDVISFLVPTINLTSKIFKYVIKVYRDADRKDKIARKDKIVYDKQFLLLAPYLYESGRETPRELADKYKEIKTDSPRFKAYLEIINKINLDNEDTITKECPTCGSMEETHIRFPGGWKKFFVSATDSTGYFLS